MQNPLSTIPEFCQENKISRSKAYDLLRTKELKAVKVGRRTYIRAEDAAKWRASLQAFESKAA